MSERIRRALGITAILGCASMAQAGPDWVEGDHGDAGTLPKSSQPINMSGSPTGAITKITGRLTGAATSLLGVDDFQDMYKFRVLQPTMFCATTACIDPKYGLCGFAEFNPRLFLFDANGIGITGNDDSFVIGVVGSTSDDSYLTGQSCDGSGSMILMPGVYHLAVTNSFNFPESAGGAIFCFGCSNVGTPTCTLGPTEISGNDGPGGTQPIANWDNNFFDGSGVGPCFGCGNYEIALCFGTVGIVTNQVIQAKMDIKPGGCPNPFNRTSNGVLPVSLLGSATFDVHDVVLSSVRISREGVAGNLAPNEGPPGPHSVFDDNASPYTGVACGCTTLNGDGIIDLSMKFKSADLVSALQLNSLSSGALVSLKITGELAGGATFEAQDCIRLVPPGTPPGMIAVNAPAAAFIEASPLDLTLDGGGFGAFLRDYPVTTVVTLRAPVMLTGKMFAGWRINGSAQLVTTPQINMAITTATHTYEAVYVTAMTPR